LHAVPTRPAALPIRQLPVVIDEQPGVIPFTEGNGCGNILFDLLFRQILNAQLNRGDACF
jgi:hypothetical protein